MSVNPCFVWNVLQNDVYGTWNLTRPTNPDPDGNGKVDMGDVAFVLSAFGKTVWPAASAVSFNYHNCPH